MTSATSTCSGSPRGALDFLDYRDVDGNRSTSPRRSRAACSAQRVAAAVIAELDLAALPAAVAVVAAFDLAAHCRRR